MYPITKIVSFIFALHSLATWGAKAQTTTLPTQATDSFEAFVLEYPQLRAFISAEGLPKEGTVSKVFERNAPQWQNVALVCDWTESMYVHGAEVLYWLHSFADSAYLSQWIFFNDGDASQQGEKVVGMTGGVYTYKGNDFEAIISLMNRVREEGNGGDAPENDLEALLYAQLVFPKANHLVLIADAQSEVRDMLLLPRLKNLLLTHKAQLHIVLCGESIQYDYLYLAQVCNASLHTAQEDWEALGTWQEGQQLQLNGTSYQWTEGYFKKVEKTTPRKKKK